MTRKGSAGLLAALVVGLVGSASPLYGVSTTVGGRPLDVTGHLEIRQVLRVDRSTPRDHNLQQISADLRYGISDSVSLHAALFAQNGGPTTEADSWGIYNFGDTFQSITPALDAQGLWLEFRGDHADLKVGLQAFAWGKLDRSQPVDVLNAERYSDPFMEDEAARKIPVPSLEAAYHLPSRPWLPEEARLTVVWVAKYVPFRFPRFGERWFPPDGVPPDVFTIPPDLFPLPGGAGNPQIDVPVAFRTRNRSAPSFGMDNAGYAVRFAGFTHGVDFALYYYHGFDSQPAFRLTAEVSAGDSSASPLGFDLQAATELTAVHRTINLWGVDAAYAVGDLTFRFEGAFVKGRPFSRDLRFLIDDPSEIADEIRDAIPQLKPGGPAVPIELPRSFVVNDALEWGVGADYNFAGYTFLLELNQTDVFGNDFDLLISDVETRLTGNVAKRLWHDDIEVKLVGVHAFESDYTFLRPTLSYLLWDRIEMSGGYLFLAGHRSSVIGQYNRNDQGFLRLRFLF